MKAAFALRPITPAPGTRMFGFAKRDRDHGCETINDDLYVRALYLEDHGGRALILGFDLLFFSRAEADRLKGAISRALDLKAREILLNCSHTHAGPAVGDWAYTEPDGIYLERLQFAVLAAAADAMSAPQPARLSAGQTVTRLPVSRRYKQADGLAGWRPSSDGEIYPHLPFCRVESQDGQIICLMFSVACHPSIINGFAVSADYPGAACRCLDRQFGKPAALFLQGCGGDSKPCVVADGKPDAAGLPTWRAGTPSDVEQAGKLVASELSAALPECRLLEPLPGGIETRLLETAYPLMPPPSREAIAAAFNTDCPVRRAWAARQAAWLNTGAELPRSAPILCQTIRLAGGLRLTALEGEPVAGIGHLIAGLYHNETVFALGYSNGQGMYLPTERMLPEEGYEVVSTHEYGFPAPAAPGFEQALTAALTATANRE